MISKTALIKPVDKGEMIYPLLQDDEMSLKCIPNESWINERDGYFPISFRLEDNIVINSIAKKYPNSETFEKYPEPNDFDERFLIGVKSCQHLRYELNCPYMKKVSALISNIKDIVAIYLIEADNSDVDVNRQRFLLMTKTALYLRSDDLKLIPYSYNNIRFTLNGLEDVTRTKDEGLLLNYMFDDNFISFAREFMQLRYNTITTVGVRHPFADTLPDFREDYLEILTDIAAGEGNLTAEKYIRLEYIAREFKVSCKDLGRWLINAYNDENKISNMQHKLQNLLANKMHTDERYILFQDMLELSVNEKGELSRKKLIDLMRRDSTAGDKFVTNYIEFIKMRRSAEVNLQRAIESIGYTSLASNLGDYLKNIHALQTYNNEMILKMIDTAVLTGDI